MKTEERTGTATEGATEESPARHAAAGWLVLVLAALGIVLVALGLSDVLSAPGGDLLGWAGFAVLTGSVVLFSFEHGRIMRHLVAERDRSSRLAEKDRLRFEHVASITHQLKTPLTSLLGYARIIRSRARTLPEKQREQFFSIMEKEGERILELINQMLQDSRMEHVAAVRRVALDLRHIAHQAAMETAGSRSRRVEIDIPDGELGLYGDPSAMHHVLTNLIDNAVKYSPEGTAVHVSFAERDGEVHLTVRDEGVGIPAEDLPRIFERFQQASDGRGQASVGLGLYIVRNLVEAHGGRVWAESEPGKGTSFVVALPRRRRS